VTLLAGPPMLNDTSSALALLRTRRSARPRDLIEPGPDAGQLQQIFEIAARTPDHGKLTPWRFVHIQREARGAFAEMLRAAYLEANPEPGRLELEAVERFAHQAPTLVVALSKPVAGTKIPLWEQQLSCGAALMNLLSACHALGFAAGCVTGWAAYSPAVLRALGCEGDERIAGFVFIGTPSLPLEDRPRPSVAEVASGWSPAAEPHRT
jgi:nitroreductase